MKCPTCQSEIEDDAEACFHCGMAVFALTRGSVLSGRYEIVQPLGRGGMGRVYKARDRVMEEHVALKVLRSEFMRDPEMSRRFVSEIKLARKIGHRNVCRIHEYGEDGDIRYIVMELIEGVTLKEHLREGGLPPDAAYDISVQIARGLNAVHELGIVHRDFKTANIMVNRQGVAKLVDFGIAKDISSDLTGPTVGGMIMGTPEYMSPEQVQGGPAGYHSDIYALGCVVYEVFTGHAPFRGATAAATVYMHVHDELPIVGQDAERIPRELAPILKRALAKDPDERYETVSEFAEALTAACAAGGYPATHRGGLRLPSAAAVPPAADTTPGRGDAAVAARPWLREPAPRTWQWVIALVAIIVGALALLAYPRAASMVLPPVTPMASAALPSPEVTPSVSPTAPAGPLATAVPESVASPAAVIPSPPPPTSPRGPSPRAVVAPTGTLRLLVVPPAEVSVDGTPLGLVSRRELSLPPGAHTVRIEHPDYQPLQRRVSLRDGVIESLVVDLAEKGIRR